jgi:hypothetical protein
MDNKKIRNIISTLIFNTAETILIVLVGKLLGLELNNIIMVMLCFMISRGITMTILYKKNIINVKNY